MTTDVSQIFSRSQSTHNDFIFWCLDGKTPQKRLRKGSPSLCGSAGAGVGAGLLWRFVCGYSKAHHTRDHVPLPLLFIVIPILYHGQTEEFVRQTRVSSGLRAFAAKFSDSKVSKHDLLLAIHNRAAKLRALTLTSLRVAVVTKLLRIQTNGYVLALSETAAVTGMPAETRQLMKDAEKLGAWCAPLTLHEIATTLRLSF